MNNRVNLGKIELADQVVAKMLIEFPDKRLQMGISNVQKACKFLLSKGQDISVAAIWGYLNAECGGKPARGTLHNDSKGIYTKVIESYKICVSFKIKYKVSKSDDYIPVNIKVYINTLENRNKHLEKILSENFEQQGRVSISTMLNQSRETDDLVTVSHASLFTKEQLLVIKRLYEILHMSDDFEFTGINDAERLVMSVDKKPLLSPNEIKLIKDLINLI